jgi:LysM repeat protein
MGKGIIYTVKKGETLESLADEFGISVDELRRFHNNWCEDIRNQIGYDIWEGKNSPLKK